MSEKLKYFIEAWEMNGVGETVATVQDSPGTVVTITVDDLRALLARQPAAIDKQDAALDPEQHGLPPYPKGNVVGPCVCGSWPGGECLKCRVIPAAPSVEQDERGAFIEAYMEARAASVAQAGAVFDNDWPAKQMWSAGIAYARAASTSANVAQGAEAVDDELFWNARPKFDTLGVPRLSLRELVREHYQHYFDREKAASLAERHIADVSKAALTAAQSASGDTK